MFFGIRSRDGSGFALASSRGNSLHPLCTSLRYLLVLLGGTRPARSARGIAARSMRAWLAVWAVMPRPPAIFITASTVLFGNFSPLHTHS